MVKQKLLDTYRDAMRAQRGLLKVHFGKPSLSNMVEEFKMDSWLLKNAEIV